MVILDSDHTKPHVLKELEYLAPLVTPGQYLIVEDTNLNGDDSARCSRRGQAELLEQIRQLLRTRRYSIHAASSVTRQGQPSRAQAARLSIRQPPLASRRLA
jgi:cephalosporin hydroxylase